MEIEKYGLSYKFTTVLPRGFITLILWSFINKIDSFNLIGGSEYDEDISEVPIEYQIDLYFKREPSNTINGAINWVKVMDDFLKSVQMIENIMTLQPNKETK